MLGKRLILISGQVMFVVSVFLSVHVAKAETLAQIIEGAKKEREVSAKLRSSLTPKSMERLEKEIREKYNVSLSIKSAPSNNTLQDLAEALMENKVRATPSYDLMNFSNEVTKGMEEGIFERVDWRPLITKDTNPNVVEENPLLRGAIVYYTGCLGLMYNPDKIPAAEIPKTLSDLADPKWKGRLGIVGYPGTWSRWAFILGKEKVVSNLRAILRNKPMRGDYADLNNRYLIGEISLAFQSSIYLKLAKGKGMPAAWQSLDFADIREYSLVVRKGSRHPNAAKLVSLYLVSPEGAKFTLEESGSGNLYYPGNYENDIRAQNQKQGIPEVFADRRQEVLDFYASKEFDQWQKEIDLIFKTDVER